MNARLAHDRLLVIGALVALIGLYGVFVIHYATDDDCEGLATGNVLDCFICAKMAVMGIDFAPQIRLPELPAVDLPPPPEPVFLVAAPHGSATGARSPPRLSV